ncbi:hypothetical protein [Serratia silvae]|uniref:DNA-binding protein n=1 Tax=Serratia silvae TaxID=2824122 RepID=A0ABT0K5Y1_9GAMM|nr:hypothetical protein [Serratia silvae]MCL1027432.1 hypothetical protein [Serratia silvae]
MIDFDLMVKNEAMGEIILFLVSRGEDGVAYPFMDRFFGRHKAAEKYGAYNLKLIEETKRLENSGQIFSAKTYGSGYKKGPNWKAPKFVTEKKYGIE